MDAPLRPDHARILPQPLVRARAAQGRFAGAVDTRGATPPPDWVVDVQRPRERDASAPGFGLQQALAVAKRVAGWLASSAPPEPHRLTPTRAQQVLDDPRDRDDDRRNGVERGWSPPDRS
jgi:hypothetical protein